MTFLPRRSFRKAGGFSLIELMVAMTLGLVLVTGLLTLMVNSRKSYEVQDYTANLQENARFAMYILSRELRMAGYYGCSSQLSNSVTDILGGAVTAVSGKNGAGSDADELTLRFADPAHADISLTAVNGPAQWALSRVPAAWEEDLAAGRPVYVLISDCGSTAVAPLTAADSGQGTINLDTTKLGREFYVGTLPINVRRLLVHTFSVGADGDGIANLMLDENLGEGPQVLVAGVENMQVVYRTPVLAQPAPLPDWNTVNSASIGLLMRSVSRHHPELGSDGQFGGSQDRDQGTYVVLDVAFKPATDGGTLPALRGRRDTFTSTATLRNTAGI